MEKLWNSFGLPTARSSAALFGYFCHMIAATPSSFYINDRFLVNSALNLVTDEPAQAPTRLEPRQMKLLCLLAVHAGELVSRERIISEIWDDYGGGDEALSQAISFLRKALQDEEKKLIRTVPKSGYLLQASVTPVSHTMAEETPFTHAPKPATRKRQLWAILAGAAIICIGLAAWIIHLSPGNQPGPVEPPGTVIDTTYQYKEMKEQQRDQLPQQE